MQRGADKPGPVVVDLAALDERRGPLWGIAGADLNATLVGWPPGEGTPEHVNDERDVLLIVVAGSGVLRLNGEEHPLHTLAAAVIEKGLPRQVVASKEGIRYLTVHLARGGLQVSPSRPAEQARDAGEAPVVTPLRTGVPVAGVDGYRGGWVAVELREDGTAAVRTAREFRELLVLDVRVLAVDIPIGLPETGRRPADVQARRFVGPRASSVFPTPPRAVLEAETFAEACELARGLTGKAISQQSFALRRRILEVDALAAQDQRILEVHPEVSFAVLARRPLRRSKHTPEGLTERRALLEAAGMLLPPPPRGVPDADLLDAAVAAWSAARAAHSAARPFPAGHTERIGAIWA